MITKALIIADPWIGYLLDGSKTWEMRSSSASHRGWFGLIRKGTGAIYGIARLEDVGAPLSPEQMVAAHRHHRIPEAMIRSGEVAKWNVPWKLAEIRRLTRPVAYTHKSGAVTWVELDAAAISGIAAQVGDLAPATQAARPPAATRTAELRKPRANYRDEVRIDVFQRGSKLRIDIEWDDGQPDRVVPRQVAAVQPALARPSSPPARPVPSSGLGLGEVVLTEGNIANSHIYLRGFFDRFPQDAVGGSNNASAAHRTVTIDWGGPEPIVTDLDGSKKLFRARGWIGAFFKLNRAAAGDRVIVEQTAPYRYIVYFRKGVSQRRVA